VIPFSRFSGIKNESILPESSGKKYTLTTHLGFDLGRIDKAI
jgi:hypothetical protein